MNFEHFSKQIIFSRPFHGGLPYSSKYSKTCRGQKFHSSTRYYELNLERVSNISLSTGPVG